jgi:pentatricopeptide repeat protein
MTSVSSGGSLIGKIGSYLQIVTKDPSSTAFVPLAEAYRQIGLLDDALEAARLGTKMLPHFSPGFSTMGRILGQMGRIDEAMSAYARALNIDRQSQAALVGLARIHLIRGERDLARKILKEAKGFHPEDEKIADMLIALDLPRPWDKIKQASQVHDAAVQEESLPAESNAPILTATLAEIYVKQGLVDKAIKVYEEILSQSPENIMAQERMMQLRGQSGAQAATPVAVPPLDGQAEVTVTEDDAAKVTPVMVATPEETESTSKNRSPIAVLQRWLTVIKEGRANVQ